MHIFKPNSEFGHVIHDLKIHGKDAPYPVFNENEIRAGTGIMFVIALVTFLYIIFTGDISPLYILAPLYLIEFIAKVFQGVGMFAWLGGQIVANQRPEWVGAIQKRFAWTIGLTISAINTIIVYFLPYHVIIAVVMPLCALCLVFMWLETSCGICVGCAIYSWLIKNRILPEPDVHPACPGGVCDIRHHKHVSHLKAWD